jgi:small conductance mechanosensitive channel
MNAALLALDRAHFEDWFNDHGTAVVSTVLLTLVATLAVRLIVPAAIRPAVARQMTGRPAVDVKRRVDTLSGVIMRTIEFLLVIFAILTILPELGIDIRPLLAGVSISSIAIGFGAQSLVKDALAGIFILTENQYAIGDIVTIGGATGTVEDITLRRTLVRDIDGVLFTVPNGIITTTANFTRDFSKVRVTIPVAPSADLEKVRAVSNDVGEALAADAVYGSMILSAPQYLRIDNIDMMGGVAVQVNGTVVPGKQWEVAGALRAKLLEAFQREGIKTPWG